MEKANFYLIILPAVMFVVSLVLTIIEICVDKVLA